MAKKEKEQKETPAEETVETPEETVAADGMTIGKLRITIE